MDNIINVYIMIHIRHKLQLMLVAYVATAYAAYSCGSYEYLSMDKTFQIYNAVKMRY